MRVNDNGTPALSDSRTFAVTVNEVNAAPVLDNIPDATINAGIALNITAQATDSDRPANGLTYSLDSGAPTGATINGRTGAFSWTPASAQAGTSYTITVRVTDDAATPASDSTSFQVTVEAVATNTPPTLAAISDQTANEGEALTLTATGEDVDTNQSLTYSLDPGARPARRSTRTPARSRGPPPRRRGRASTTSPCASPTTARRL